MNVMIGTTSLSPTPPIRCWSPYGRTITSPADAQCFSWSATCTQQVPLETTWKRTTRSVPGLRKAAVAGPGSDS